MQLEGKKLRQLAECHYDVCARAIPLTYIIGTLGAVTIFLYLLFMFVGQVCVWLY